MRTSSPGFIVTNNDENNAEDPPGTTIISSKEALILFMFSNFNLISSRRSLYPKKENILKAYHYQNQQVSEVS